MCLDGLGKTLSVRHASALAAQLPSESRLFRLRLDEGGRESLAWTPQVRLLAMAVNALNAIVWQNGSGKQHNKPTPILPPEERRKKERRSSGVSMTSEELLARLDELHSIAAENAASRK